MKMMIGILIAGLLSATSAMATTPDVSIKIDKDVIQKVVGAVNFPIQYKYEKGKNGVIGDNYAEVGKITFQGLQEWKPVDKVSAEQKLINDAFESGLKESINKNILKLLRDPTSINDLEEKYGKKEARKFKKLIQKILQVEVIGADGKKKKIKDLTKAELDNIEVGDKGLLGDFFKAIWDAGKDVGKDILSAIKDLVEVVVELEKPEVEYVVITIQNTKIQTTIANPIKLTNVNLSIDLRFNIGYRVGWYRGNIKISKSGIPLDLRSLSVYVIANNTDELKNVVLKPQFDIINVDIPFRIPLLGEFTIPVGITNLVNNTSVMQKTYEIANFTKLEKEIPFSNGKRLSMDRIETLPSVNALTINAYLKVIDAKKPIL